MKILIPFAALAALLPLASVSAEPPPRSLAVGYGDLDIVSAEGRAKLERRVQRAADEVCGGASDLDLAGQNEMRRCRTETAAIALAKAEAHAQAISNGRTVRVAATGR